MSTHSVHVSNISSTTTEQHLVDFFTFCGKIHSIHLDERAKTANIHFEKPSAAKTALMLNGGTLDGAHLTVTSESHEQEVAEETLGENTPIDQSDKPRAAIAAEYLAKGYVLSDHILARAIDMDKKQGISSRFLNYFNQFDHTVGEKIQGPEGTLSGTMQGHLQTATQRAKSIDEQRGLTNKANEYYSKALQSQFGQKVLQFYTTTSKQVLDIHEEAKRIAETQKASATVTSTETPTHPVVAAAGVPVTAPPTVV